MRRRFGGARSGARSVKRKVDWGAAQADVGLAGTAGAADWIFSPLDARAFFTSPTVLAIRSFVSMRLRTAPASGAAVFAGLGIIRWDGVDAVTPGNPPLPLTDGNLDWMARWIACFPALTTVGTLGNPNVFDNTHLSKAKRKLENTAGLLLCWEVSTIDPSAFVDFASDHRYLVQQV